MFVVDLQPAPDRLFLVVLALDEGAGVFRLVIRRGIVLDMVDVAGLLALAPSGETLYELLVRSFERDGSVQLYPGLLQSFVQSLGLRLVAREAVQYPGIILLQVRHRHLDDDLIRDQLAPVVIVFDLLPKLGAGFDLRANQVAGGDVLRAGLLRDPLRLSSLPGPLGAKQYDPHFLPFKNPS